MDNRLRHARRRGGGRLGALVAVALVAPALALAPANAALGSAGLPGDLLEPVLSPLDPVVSTVLVDPDLSGAGAVTGAGGALSCTNATSGTVDCADPLTLADLGGTPADVLLTATPASGWELSGWSGACTGSSPTCLLSAEALSSAVAGTPLAPVAIFVPADGAAEPNPLCEPSGGAAPGIDCEPPVTVLKSKPTVTETARTDDGAGVTRQTSATFTFAAMEPKEDGSAGTTPTPDATFACRLLEKPATTGAFAACPGGTAGTAAYTGLTEGTYEFAVQATDGEGNTDTTPETFTWTVDTTAPETVLTSRPRFWVLARTATFGVDVVPPDVRSDMTFQCSLDGAGRACPTVRFGPGTHTFGAAAEDKAGNADPTPATHSFTMPLNNKDLNHSAGWSKTRLKGAFLNSASVTKKKDARLATRATGITRIALVASKGRGFGTVKVMLGKKTLKKVSLAQQRSTKKKVLPVASFSTPVSGKVTVQVVSQGKKIVVEGLGIATR